VIPDIRGKFLPPHKIEQMSLFRKTEFASFVIKGISIRLNHGPDIGP